MDNITRLRTRSQQASDLERDTTLLERGSIRSDGSGVVSREISRVHTAVGGGRLNSQMGHHHLDVVPEPEGEKNDDVKSVAESAATGHNKCHWVVATSHIITAVIGAGVLGLPSAFSWLGWPSAFVLLTLMYCATLFTSFLLADVYEVDGKRHPTYGILTSSILNKWQMLAVVISQRANQILITIAYTITAASSIVTIEEAFLTPQNCLTYSTAPASCITISTWQATLMFGAIQLAMSQLPNLESIWWVSLIGAGTSIGYSIIAFVCSCVIADSQMKGTTTGKDVSPNDKAFGVLNAIGTMLFAYNFSSVLVEIQDTLQEPPQSKISMKKACHGGIGMAYLFYAAVGFAGYWALGNNVPGDILSGFSNTAIPVPVIVLANVFVLIHMFSAFQVYAQPVFVSIEEALAEKFACCASLPPLTLRLIVRSIYVCIATLIAVIMPFFSAIVGLVGALTFYVPAIYAPIAMWIIVYKPSIIKVRAMNALSILAGITALFAIVGSVQSLIVALSSAKIFGQ